MPAKGYERIIQRFCEDLATPLVKERIHTVTNFRIKKNLCPLQEKKLPHMN